MCVCVCEEEEGGGVVCVCEEEEGSGAVISMFVCTCVRVCV